MSPRVGIAWSPDELHGKTVIRTGFGLFVAPIVISYLAQNGNYSSNPIIDQEGFSQETVMTPSTNNYLSPSATFSDPFPGGAIVQPNAAAVGQTTFLGQHHLLPESARPRARTRCAGISASSTASRRTWCWRWSTSATTRCTRPST